MNERISEIEGLISKSNTLYNTRVNQLSQMKAGLQSAVHAMEVVIEEKEKVTQENSVIEAVEIMPGRQDILEVTISEDMPTGKPELNFCMFCGNKLSGIGKFCSRCGAEIRTVEVNSYCSKCGKEIDPNVKFCKYCGSPVEGAKLV